jgi:hypothetical protein
MTDDDGSYDPTEPDPPAREPPRRSTAPQSSYESRQVLLGAALALSVLVVVAALALGLT